MDARVAAGSQDGTILAPGVDAAAVAGYGVDSGRRVGLVPDWSCVDPVSMLSSVPRKTRAMAVRGVGAAL